MFKKLMYVMWKDHHGPMEAQWVHFPDDDAPEPLIVSSVGWLKYDTKDMITLIPHVYGDEDGNTYGQGELHILKSCIIKKKTIKI